MDTMTILKFASRYFFMFVIICFITEHLLCATIPSTEIAEINSAKTRKLVQTASTSEDFQQIETSNISTEIFAKRRKHLQNMCKSYQSKQTESNR